MTQYRVVYNSCFGGYSLSQEAVELGKELSGDTKNWMWEPSIRYGTFEGPRHDPVLIEVVKRLGERANGSSAELKIKTIDTPIYKIEEYDGRERVIEGSSEWIVIT